MQSKIINGSYSTVSIIPSLLLGRRFVAKGIADIIMNGQ